MRQVTDVAVIGVDWERQGEAPRAYVVPAADSGLQPAAVADLVAAKLSPYKQLRGGVAFVDSIPKSAAGKILRKDLKARYLATGV